MKQSPEEKVVQIVCNLKKIRARKESGLFTGPYAQYPVQLERQEDPVASCDTFLKLFFASMNTTAQDLLKVTAPSGVLNCQALSSLHHFAQAKRTRMNLTAWMPVHESLSMYPEKHLGVGQIAGASREFLSILADLLNVEVVKNMNFSTTLMYDSIVVSSSNDQVTAQFSWASEGLTGMGFPKEIIFSGLIRCAFCKDGISSAWIHFDSCTIVRGSGSVQRPQAK